MTANNPGVASRIPPADGIVTEVCRACGGMGVSPPGPTHGETCPACNGAGETYRELTR